MMAKKISFISLSFLFYACSHPLMKTEIDSQMRLQGSYTCKKINNYGNEPKDPLEKNIMSARIRCHKDSYQFTEDKVVFKREFFNKIDCSDPLGEITFNGDLINKNSIHLEDFYFKKFEPNWVMEKTEACILNKLPINKSLFFVDVQNCDFAIKALKLKDKPIRFENLEKNKSNSFYEIRANQEICRRY